jgi:hypothetical protein
MTDPDPDLGVDVAYRVVPTGDTFAVEVTVTGNLPAMVIGLESRQAAEAWIADHRVRAAANRRAGRRRTFRRKE